MSKMLLEMWAIKSVSQATAILTAPLVPSTRTEDKVEQLAKIARMDNWLRTHGPQTLPSLMRDQERSTGGELKPQIV